MNRKAYYVMCVGNSLVFLLSFFVAETLLKILLGGLVFLCWLLPLMNHEKVTAVEEEEEPEDEPKRIPGYEKSGLEIKGCYNCFYSKDIGNATFVYCNKYQQKVYRDYACDFYKV